jgi:hypothetical protein
MLAVSDRRRRRQAMSPIAASPVATSIHVNGSGVAVNVVDQPPVTLGYRSTSAPGATHCRPTKLSMSRSIVVTVGPVVSPAVA